MGKLTTLVGRFSTRGKDKGGVLDQPERRETTPPRGGQQKAEGSAGPYADRNGRQASGPELSEESERGEGAHDVAAFGSDVSTEFKREAPHTYSGELDGLVVTRPTFQSMVFQRPKNAAGDSKVCATCRREADPRHPGSLFTAECGHTFHFECIALGLDLGQLRCPLCRKTWRRLPDTGAWANGALGYSYQGQPLNRKGAGARPPRSGRPSNTPPRTPVEDDVDLDDIPVAPVIHSSNPSQPPGPAPLALERPPTFRDMTEAGTGPSEGPPASAFKGSWAKRPSRLDADDYEAEQSPGDPFHFHHSERFSEASPGGLDDLPSPVALKRGGDFAKRKGGGAAPDPEFCFGMNANSNAQERSPSPPEAAPARDAGGVTMPVQPPPLKVNKPGSVQLTGPQAPPIFARRRRTSKDSAPLPSIIEAASPDKKSIHLKPPPGRKTPPVSPRRRYERRQAANSEDMGAAPKLVANPLEGKRRSHSIDGDNRASGEGAREGGSLTPPPGRGSLTPPPGRGVRPAASKQDDQDWAHFFAPSREFKPTGGLVESSGSDEESPPASGVTKAPHFGGGPAGKAPKDLNASRAQSRNSSVAEPLPGDKTWNQRAELFSSGRALPPDHPLFASYSKAFKVLDGNPPEAAGVSRSPMTSRPGSPSPERGRGSPSPTKAGHPSREFPDHLESFRASVPPADGTWSSMDEHERDIRVDANSNIVYSRSTDRPHAPGERPNAAEERPNPIADSRGWFYNSDFGSDGISEVLRGVQAQRGANQPEAWNQASGHQFGGSLQADGGFDMARFEAAIGPEMFDDDDPVTPLQPIPGSAPDLEISVRSEHPAVAAADSRDKFLCLVTVKAAPLAKPPASDPSSSNQSLPGASSHHSRKASGSRSFDSDLGASGVPSRRRTGSRGSAELDSLEWTRTAGDRLQRAGSADVALLPPLEKRDSADLDGWLTEQMTERLQLQESVCPAPEAPPMPDVRAPEEARAPLDLVAVLDVSKSMMGRKLRLVQKTIEFVTQNLGPNDRLSVVAFAKRAYRVTPLLRVTERGRERIVSAVKRIEVSSGTNIGAGLRMGLKVLKDARTRNPVRAVVLLSDGQDSWGRREMSLLLPEWGVTDSAGVAVHTFGFGGDHDAEAMFSVASEAKGTYSFIKKTEGVQDAFARCIGGLLTVVAQDVTLSLQVGGGSGNANGCRIQHLHAGMFERTVDEAGTRAEIVLGDMYAEEARDILVELSLPEFAALRASDERQLVLAASGNYVQARTQLIKAVTPAELVVSRPLQVPTGEGLVDIGVDRQRNRLIATRAMSTAREWAELGQLGAAQKMLENAIAQIGQSAAFAGGDPLTLQLDNDLRECAVGFASMHDYEERGRAFSMSQGLSHTLQRASTSTFRRGSRTGSAGYNTSTMEFMISRSQCFEVRR